EVDEAAVGGDPDHRARVGRDQQRGGHRERGRRRHARARRRGEVGAARGARLRARAERRGSREPGPEAEGDRPHGELERGQRARDAAAPARKVLVEVRDATEVRMAQHARRAPGRRSAPVVHGDGLRHVAQAEAGGAQPLFSSRMARPVPAAAPTLDAPPKPRLDALWSSRTRGNFAATIACEPSLEPLSTTIVSTRSPSAAPSSAARERARCSRVFQETTTVVTSILTGAPTWPPDPQRSDAPRRSRGAPRGWPPDPQRSDAPRRSRGA